MDRRLSEMINYCKVDRLLALLAYARVNELDWSNSKVLDWF